MKLVMTPKMEGDLNQLMDNLHAVMKELSEEKNYRLTSNRKGISEVMKLEGVVSSIHDLLCVLTGRWGPSGPEWANEAAVRNLSQHLADSVNHSMGSIRRAKEKRKNESGKRQV